MYLCTTNQHFKHMKQEEKQVKVKEYTKKTKHLLGTNLLECNCKFYGDNPVMEITYQDYKTSKQTREELEQLIPGVELAKVKRVISAKAILDLLFEVLESEYLNGDKAFVRTTNGDEITLSDWGESILFDKDLSASI